MSGAERWGLSTRTSLSSPRVWSAPLTRLSSSAACRQRVIAPSPPGRTSSMSHREDTVHLDHRRRSHARAPRVRCVPARMRAHASCYCGSPPNASSAAQASSIMCTRPSNITFHVHKTF
ncbi:hypothetical protein HYPSUDRAFT_46789 [Hypholoma sublateritium FD-334 SS-4]|uniref:Uncharacterized protein n=1 Tax=Hypholoma sublateritium (strain FD-334 SS-4) TaxID=945553 RepID=A0A0D2KR15_HYPSF|nr:hypothetical protein HYPSUDRAFT_46789 [Hypholoma sublateritium FD-334 SS-4]